MLQCQVREQVEESLEEQRRVAVPVEGRDGFRGAASLELRAAQLPSSGVVAEADGPVIYILETLGRKLARKLA